MQKNSNAHNFAVAISIAAIVLASFAGTAAFAQPANPENDPGVKTIDAMGTYSMSTDPDKADVYIGVESNRPSAIDAEKELAARINVIKNRLIDEGIASADISTTGYNMHQQRTASSTGDQYTYTATEILKVTMRNTSKVGTVIDAATEAGANQVNRIEYGLSDSKLEELKTQALKEAMKNARSQADYIANELGVKITGVERVISSGFRFENHQLYGMVTETHGAAQVAPYPATEIYPGTLQFTASVDIEFAFE